MHFLVPKRLLGAKIMGCRKAKTLLLHERRRFKFQKEKSSKLS